MIGHKLYLLLHNRQRDMCKMNCFTEWIEDLLEAVKDGSNPEAVKLLEDCGKCCAIRKKAINSQEKLREKASACCTRSDFVAFLNEQLPVSFTEAEDGIIMRLGKDQCSCPMSSQLTKNTDALCHCTVGSNKAMWSAFFGKPVQVEIVETILRGGKDCVFKICV